MNPDVQHYSSHIKELAHSQAHKARQFIKYNCIQYDKEEQTYFCSPIPGYNQTRYRIEKNDNGDFECNCQGCQKRIKEEKRPNCSHIGALYLHFELICQKMNWGKYSQKKIGD